MMDEQESVQVQVGGNRVLVTRTGADVTGVVAECRKLVADREDKVALVGVSTAEQHLEAWDAPRDSAGSL